MLSGCNKYFNRFLLKPMLIIGFIFSFSIAASAQFCLNYGPGKHFWMNPLLLGTFKKPLKPNPLLSEYIKPSAHELMYWPNFPLNAAQIQARSKQWPSCSKSGYTPLTLGEQIASDIIKNQVNSLIYGKKMPVAVTPKF
jgi:hypothetical protein